VTPTGTPTGTPTFHPTLLPTIAPTVTPTGVPTVHPTITPTGTPTSTPTFHPTGELTIHPTLTPEFHSKEGPTVHPTITPGGTPTYLKVDKQTTVKPTIRPTVLSIPQNTGGGAAGNHAVGFRPGAFQKTSDIRLKRDIVPLATLDNGIELYRFRYKGSDRTTYVGVMAQEVQKIVPSAVSRDRDGYLLVNYDRLGLKFMTWDEWTQQHRQ
jgi:hypothetical protein